MIENIALLPEFAAQYPFLWGGFLFLSGLAFGSFFNVVIHRLPLMMEQAEESISVFPRRSVRSAVSPSPGGTIFRCWASCFLRGVRAAAGSRSRLAIL
jgi:hypothetical protein